MAATELVPVSLEREEWAEVRVALAVYRNRMQENVRVLRECDAEEIAEEELSLVAVRTLSAKIRQQAGRRYA